MDMKQLQSFAAVVEQRSFTRAAEKLYLSQPTISTHIGPGAYGLVYVEAE